jgi:hypothetical protein
MILSGITSTTSIESEEKEEKMFNFTTNVPMLDAENAQLFRASELLEKLGNTPGLTANAFYGILTESGYPPEEHERLTLAAVAIETMMSTVLDPDSLKEPTVH